MNYTLMTPGPVPLPDWVLKELAQPVLHHRTKEFETILHRVLTDLKYLFQTKQHCFVLASVGTGAMEAALVNTVKKGDKVLVINAGKFGHRWRELAQHFGYPLIHLEVPWGQDVDLQKVEDLLLQNPDTRAILCQACETSTGAQLPIQKLSQIKKPQDCLLIVDAVTALGAYDIPMDQWGLDVVISGSQKALMLPTGLSVLSLSEKAWASAQKVAAHQAYYWNLVEEKKANDNTQTRWSSAVTLIRGLDVVLQHLKKVGLQNHFAEIAARAEAFRQQVITPELQVFPRTPSPSLTALLAPANTDAQKIQKQLQDQFKIIIMAGQDAYKNRLLRIGHMGAMTREDLKKTAQAIHQVLHG